MVAGFSVFNVPAIRKKLRKYPTLNRVYLHSAQSPKKGLAKAPDSKVFFFYSTYSE